MQRTHVSLARPCTSNGYDFTNFQLRIGQDYRVSRVEHVEPPEARADRIVQQINAILSREIGWGY